MSTETEGDFAAWKGYFDELESAMQEFEVALSQRDVQPLRQVRVPAGAPPASLHSRWLADYQRISELEFRALALREDLRTEFNRLHGLRRPSPPAAGGYGSSIDITG